jgi:hypothetical protein
MQVGRLNPVRDNVPFFGRSDQIGHKFSNFESEISYMLFLYINYHYNLEVMDTRYVVGVH